MTETVRFSDRYQLSFLLLIIFLTERSDRFMSRGGGLRSVLNAL